MGDDFLPLIVSWLTVKVRVWVAKLHTDQTVGSSVMKARVVTVSGVTWTFSEVSHSVIWAPKISLNDGRYVIRPFECKIIGQAEGLARVKASIHTFFTTFDDEEWRIITLFVNHLDSQLKYTDLFAASCGSLGEFTDIKQSEEGYA